MSEMKMSKRKEVATPIPTAGGAKRTVEEQPLSKSLYESQVGPRRNPKPKPQTRFKTGIDGLDDIMKGLPHGMTIFYGDAGSGKSLLARQIGKSHKTAYIVSEVENDAPNRDDYPNVNVFNYTAFQPNASKAFKQLISIAEYEKPDIIVIDSITSFYSKSNKALPESEIRQWAHATHSYFENVLPVIGVSEVRGTGFNRSLAGGPAVKHACSMLVELGHTYVEYDGQAKSLKAEFGEDVYTLRVHKDKHGMADTSLHKLKFGRDGYVFTNVK